MDGPFLGAFRSAIESGRFETLADLYAPRATFEGFLPGGVREASGPAAIVAQIRDRARALAKPRRMEADPGDDGRRGDPARRSARADPPGPQGPPCQMGASSATGHTPSC